MFNWLPYYERPIKQTTVIKQVERYNPEEVSDIYVDAIFRIELVAQALRDLEGKTDEQVRDTIEQLRNARTSLEHEVQTLGEKVRQLRDEGKDIRKHLDSERDDIQGAQEDTQEQLTQLQERIDKRQKKGKDTAKYDNDMRDLKAKRKALQLRRQIVEKLLGQFD